MLWCRGEHDGTHPTYHFKVSPRSIWDKLDLASCSSSRHLYQSCYLKIDNTQEWQVHWGCKQDRANYLCWLISEYKLIQGHSFHQIHLYGMPQKIWAGSIDSHPISVIGKRSRLLKDLTKLKPIPFQAPYVLNETSPAGLATLIIGCKMMLRILVSGWDPRWCPRLEPY